MKRASLSGGFAPLPTKGCSPFEPDFCFRTEGSDFFPARHTISFPLIFSVIIMNYSEENVGSVQIRKGSKPPSLRLIDHSSVSKDIAFGGSRAGLFDRHARLSA
jgi:hypothetical protein